MTRGLADVNGATLAYEVAGSGPPVALIHGFSFDMLC
jgi:pimeloyl-ACP methyl ester carboxylesterase